ncbi:dehydrogenase [Rhodovulum viride]|uniref:Dehydrogenase n=1 Tax=Rhodovulum viride TaxID=1231134 RepID=A0ABX9DEH7_9RHOB|nr:dehydrogenase [Rhodovulum viride]RAP40750.1 dehydrogenase [Rhodovulum viride]
MSDRRLTTRARAPLRLGLAGGGTDLSPYCDLYGGAVLNVTINRFAFASIEARDDGRIVFAANDLDRTESFGIDDDLSGAALALHRGVYDRMVAEFNGGNRFGATIQTNVEAPAGSGLGSSSALVVALVDAFRTHLGAPLGPYDVAHLAYEIERLDLGLAGGKQDQYAAAFGGVNFIEFLAGDRVIVNPLRIPRDILNEMECRLVTCFSGVSRHSADIIERQTASVRGSDRAAVEAMHRLKSDSIEMKRALMTGDFDGLAAILHHSWAAKKATAATVSSPHIEEMFAHALAHGAEAGKVSGAGGGGFMFFLVDPPRRFALIEALRAIGGDADPVVFAESGCQSWRLPCPR